MADILLDTSVILDHLNHRAGYTEYLTHLVGEGHLLACCAVNFTEVYAGLRSGEEEATREFLYSLAYCPITQDIAMQAGLLRRDWRKKGHTLSYTDVTIAAVALANGLSVLTGNRKHFPMPELSLFPLPEERR